MKNDEYEEKFIFDVDEYKTVGELREFLARADLHDNDLTNVRKFRVESDRVRVIMTTYYE